MPELSSFISQIKDFARPNLFKVEFENNHLPKFNTTKLTFLCKSSSIVFPTFTEGIEYVNNNNLKSAAGFDKDPIDMSFNLDTELFALDFFLSWYNKMWDPVTKTFGYKNDYASDATVYMYSRNMLKSPIMSAKYVDIYPTAISGLDLAWETTDSISEIQVSFNYDDVKYNI